MQARRLHVKNMDAVRTTFNPAQLHILEMLNYCRDEQSLYELKDVLADFYARQVQQEADRLWDEGTLGREAIERLLNEHCRTPYNREAK